MRGVLFALLAASASPQAPPRSAPARPDLSWADADSLSRKLEAIVERRPGAKPGPTEKVLITQGELNSYLNLTLGTQMPPGLDELDFRFEADRLTARAMVDLDKVKGVVSGAGRFNPISYLRGRVPVEVRGRIESGDGFGSVEFEDVRLGGLPVPVSLLGQIVAASTRTADKPQGFDILAPFRLPYSVKRVRIQPGKAVLEL